MGKILKRFYLFLLFSFLYAPILILIIFSFNDSRSRGKWGGFTLRWYAEMFENSAIMGALTNTLLIAVISAVVATVIGTAAAVGMQYMKKPIRSLLMNVTYLPIMNPDIVTGISLMLLFIFVHAQMGFVTLLLAHITFNIPYVMLSVQPKLKQLDKHIYEAAEDLGAGGFYTFFRVILPEIMPGIITGMILAFTLSLDDFVISFFTTGPGVSTLSVEIYSMARKGINPSINALSALMFVCVLLLLILINKRTNKEDVA